MRAVLISISPKYCNLISNRFKTIEVRKTKPKIDVPFKCYIYCTKPSTNNPNEVLELRSWTTDTIYRLNGKVIGEFVCDTIYNADDEFRLCWSENEDCLTDDEINDYATRGKPLYGWHISNFKLYEKPMELTDFKGRKLVWRGNNHVHTCGQIKRAPQSWCYVEEI